jgi:hypothetical protein
MKTIEAYECSSCGLKLFDKQEMIEHEDKCCKRFYKIINILLNANGKWTYSVGGGGLIKVYKDYPVIEGKMDLCFKNKDTSIPDTCFFTIKYDPLKMLLNEAFQRLHDYLSHEVLYHLGTKTFVEYMKFIERVQGNIGKSN